MGNHFIESAKHCWQT